MIEIRRLAGRSAIAGCILRPLYERALRTNPWAGVWPRRAFGDGRRWVAAGHVRGARGAQVARARPEL